jgi:NAD-dependent dihydropyrimidine dehydrogenase PreA subunit
VTHVITAACLGSRDASCVAVCPVDCIYDAERMFVIHPEECIDCGACVPECPVEAIYPEPDLPEAEREFAAINAAVMQGVDAVGAALAARGDEDDGGSATAG